MNHLVPAFYNWPLPLLAMLLIGNTISVFAFMFLAYEMWAMRNDLPTGYVLSRRQYLYFTIFILCTGVRMAIGQVTLVIPGSESARIALVLATIMTAISALAAGWHARSLVYPH